MGLPCTGTTQSGGKRAAWTAANFRPPSGNLGRSGEEEEPSIWGSTACAAPLQLSLSPLPENGGPRSEGSLLGPRLWAFPRFLADFLLLPLPDHPPSLLLLDDISEAARSQTF